MATLAAGAVVPVPSECTIEVRDDLELAGARSADGSDLAGEGAGVCDDGVGSGGGGGGGHGSGEVEGEWEAAA
uniref:Uncharacterized protein n=1 Tax=Arundo donax TaxID=35708 RepID=A0A0A8XQG0_ARUDO